MTKDNIDHPREFNNFSKDLNPETKQKLISVYGKMHEGWWTAMKARKDYKRKKTFS